MNDQTMNNQAFKDGQTFYILAPGAHDKNLAWKLLEADIKNAFASPEELKETYKNVPDADEVIAYYDNYRLGILDKMKNYPSIVPPKVKKILAKYWFE